MTGDSLFTFETSGSVLIVVPNGDLFKYRYNDVRDGYNAIHKELDESTVTDLLFDFETVTHFGSTFIGMLVKLAKRARHGGGEAALCNLNENMTEVLKSLMLLENVSTDFFWRPFASRDEAITMLTNRRGGSDS